MASDATLAKEHTEQQANISIPVLGSTSSDGYDVDCHAPDVGCEVYVADGDTLTSSDISCDSLLDLPLNAGKKDFES